MDRMLRPTAALVTLGLLVSCETGTQPTAPDSEGPGRPAQRPAYDCTSHDASSNLTALGSSVVAVTTATGMEIIEPRTGSVSSLPGYTFHSWSPNGVLLAAVRAGEIGIFDRTLASPLAVLPVTDASWGPESRRIGYFDEPDFVVVDLVSGEIARHSVCPDMSDVPSGLGHCAGATWSRAIDWILVHSRVMHFGNTHLSRTDGSDAEELGQAGHWSSDGRFLFLNAGGEYDWDFQILDGRTRDRLMYQAVSPTSGSDEQFTVRWEGKCHLSMITDYEATTLTRVAWDLCNGSSFVALPDDLGTEHAWWTANGQQMAYLTVPDSLGHRQLMSYNPASVGRQSLCDIQLPYPEDPDFTFRLSAYPWSHAGSFLLATVTDTVDGIDKLALISRDEEGLRFLTEAAEDGHWSP